MGKNSVISELAVDCANTDLIAAATSGNEARLRDILRFSFDHAHRANPYGRTVLMQAAKAGHVQCVELLLPYSNALAQDRYKSTALMEAVQSGNAACIELLLPVSDALAANHYGMTALMWASLHGHTFSVQLLLPASDAKAADRYGWTPLMWAARGGHGSCVQLLLPFSNISAENDQGRTAYSIADDHSYTELKSSIYSYALATTELALLSLSTPHTAKSKRHPRV